MGIGAVVTLASWNASEYASGSFTAGTFSLESSLLGVNFASHAVGSPLTLPLTLPAGNLSPGDILYQPFVIRLAAGTTRGATVTVTSPTGTGVVSNLTYSLISPSVYGCGSGTTGTNLITGATVGTASGASTFTLAVGTSAAVPGAPTYLCFIVTAGPNLLQGQTGSATWDFAAVSS